MDPEGWGISEDTGIQCVSRQAFIVYVLELDHAAASNHTSAHLSISSSV